MEDSTNRKGEIAEVERQKIAELIQTKHVEKKNWYWIRGIWHNRAIDNKSNSPSPWLAKEGKCSVAGRGNVTTLCLVTHRFKPRFTHITDVYIVLMDKAAQSSAFTRCSQWLHIEGGDGKTGWPGRDLLSGSCVDVDQIVWIAARWRRGARKVLTERNRRGCGWNVTGTAANAARDCHRNCTDFPCTNTPQTAARQATSNALRLMVVISSGFRCTKAGSTNNSLLVNL